VEINEEEGSAVLDFEGTGCEVRGNLNAPISVVHSAVIYCMRAMLNVDIPLNAGCLVPIESTFFGTNRKSNDYIDVNYCSQDSQKISSFPIQDRCCVWRKCVDLAAHCRCSSQGVSCVCCQSRVHQVRYSFSNNSNLIFYSNLTFGTGGKDKNGVAIAGWGYYEV
jgi:5-oxoprolinase (ATP-hydrolysing)